MAHSMVGSAMLVKAVTGLVVVVTFFAEYDSFPFLSRHRGL